MNKCMASENGICRNVYAFGTKCNGYSTQCKLKPGYDSVERAAKCAAESIKRAFGIKGDSE